MGYDALIGKWFNSFVIVEGEKQRRWQGRVIDFIAAAEYRSFWLVETYSFIDGGQYSYKVVDLSDMEEWEFFNTADEMRSNQK